jgi:predicted dehydrogenase
MALCFPLKAALLGCGKIGWQFQDDPGASHFGICTHAAAWSTLGDVQLVAVADADTQKARRCAARWQVPVAYQDVRNLLDASQPDVVSIATPDETHFSLSQQCLDHPSVRAVLVEKPLASNVAEAIQLDALAKRLNKTIVVNYSRRFCPVYQSLRQDIRRGDYGAIRLIRVLYTKGLRHNGSHALDLMQFWFSRIVLLRAEVPSWAVERSDNSADPPRDVLFSLSGGGVGMLHSLPFQEYTLFEMDLCFDKARIVFTEGGDTLETHAIVENRPFVGYRRLASRSKQEGCLRDYLLHAASHVIAVMQGTQDNVSTVGASIALLQEYETILSKQP